MILKNVYMLNGCVKVCAALECRPEVNFTMLFKPNGEIVRYRGKVKHNRFISSIEEFMFNSFYGFCINHKKELDALKIEVED